MLVDIKQFCLLCTLLVASQINLNSAGELPSCMDEDGNPVDWYIAYKFPALSSEPKPFNSGYAYAYFTSESVKGLDPTTYSIKQDADIDSVVFLNKFKQLLLRALGYIFTGQKKSDYSTTSKAHKKADSNDAAGDLYWTISAKLLTDPDSIVMRTLEVAYNNEHKKGRKSNNDLNSIFYNDQPPEVGEDEEAATNSNRRAHSKGVVLIDDETGNGIWLTHSTPAFPPPRKERLEFFENSKRYGQTFMCMNFDLDRSGKQIVNHLINMYPVVYDSQISKHLLTLIPDLNLLALEGERRKSKDTVTKLAQVITTRQGQDLYLYSKSAKFNDDMYAGWIDHELKTPLFVETWRKGSGNPLDSSCPRDDYHVNNVQDMKLTYENNAKIEWSYSQDHSKWAISETNDPGVVCITDINRMQSQFKRGGGAVCIKCPSCWSVFSKTIADLEPCPKSPKRPKVDNPPSQIDSSRSSIEHLVKKLGQLVLQ